MPIYEIEVQAKIFIKIEGNTPEEAVKNTNALLDDFYMQLPCGGHTINFGNYQASVWADEGCRVVRQVPDGPEEKFNMKAYMEMCFGDEVPDELLNSEGAKGEDLPLANKDSLLRSTKDVQQLGNS